jgi:serine/threonine protein kinase
MDYIAPEQTSNSAAVDRRADIYSMGCTLYYAVTGRPPFPGGTSKEKIQRQRREEPESLLDIKPTLPVEFVVLIRRMMAKSPADRPATAEQVRGLLRRWAGGAALPLDRKDDPEYSTAVFALQEGVGVESNSSESSSSAAEDDSGSEWTATPELADKISDYDETFRDAARWKLPDWRNFGTAGFVTLGLFAAMALMGLGAFIVWLVAGR